LAKLHELYKERAKSLLELKTFQRLEENEQKAIVKRTNSITDEVAIYPFSQIYWLLHPLGKKIEWGTVTALIWEHHWHFHPRSLHLFSNASKCATNQIRRRKEARGIIYE
jgi:hypothetical protein